MEETVACVCVGRGQLLPQPQLFTDFDLGKPEERFLASSLLVPSRSRTRLMLQHAELSPSFMLSGFSPGACEEISENSTPSQFVTPKCVS